MTFVTGWQRRAEGDDAAATKEFTKADGLHKNALRFAAVGMAMFIVGSLLAAISLQML